MTNNDNPDWRRDRLALLRKYEILRDQANSATDKEIAQAGCICPTGAEAGCKRAMCPRKAMEYRT